MTDVILLGPNMQGKRGEDNHAGKDIISKYQDAFERC
jgi:hypothetical protein